MTTTCRVELRLAIAMENKTASSPSRLVSYCYSADRARFASPHSFS
jgi:hypothetical protein